MTHIYVLTCARTQREERWPYLHETLRQIERERIPGVPHFLLVDGEEQPSGVDEERWKVVPFTEAHLFGNKFAYWAILKHAAASGADALIFEDDITFCRNAVRRMLKFDVPDDLAWVQFFSPHVLQTESMIPGLWRPPAELVSFCQAVKFPHRTLRTLVKWSGDRDFQFHNESDNALRLASERLGLRYGVHAPDLVQHVGAVSQANPEDALDVRRTAKMFSASLDALTLYQRDDLYR